MLLLNLLVSTQVANLSTEDSELVEKSLSLLCQELKCPSKFVHAMESEIFAKLKQLMTTNLSNPCVIQKSLVLLQILSNNFDASLKMVACDSLIKTILKLMSSDQKFTSSCAEILLSLSSTPPGLLNIIVN